MEQKVDNLMVKRFKTRQEMGTCAAKEAAEYLRKLGEVQTEINVLFAAAPSQDDFLSSLLKEKDVPWEKVNAMQLDDYVNIRSDAPQRFANFLKRSIFDHVPLKDCLLLNCENICVEEELDRYAKVLASHPVDVAFIGIGENGHIAFNDPSLADFFDPKLIREVQLEEASRVQQVNDGCFAKLEDVPKTAMTVTVPAILRAERVFCIVPCLSKATAIYDTLNALVSCNHPSTALRLHKHATLYIDQEAASKL